MIFNVGYIGWFRFEMLLFVRDVHDTKYPGDKTSFEDRSCFPKFHLHMKKDPHLELKVLQILCSYMVSKRCNNRRLYVSG